MENPEAFPRPYSYDPGNGPDDDEHAVAQAGMTLRDYFAAKALQAILPVANDVDKRRGERGVQACSDDYAQVAYILADSMMKARKQA